MAKSCTYYSVLGSYILCLKFALVMCLLMHEKKQYLSEQ